MGTFIFRTTGFNSIRTLTARLHYSHAVSSGLLSCMPLELKLRGKSTTQSFRSAIYYVDMTIRDGLSLEEAIQQTKAQHQQRFSAGYDQAALDKATKLGFAKGAFEDREEAATEAIEEFYPESQSINSTPTSLVEKLDQRGIA